MIAPPFVVVVRLLVATTFITLPFSKVLEESIPLLAVYSGILFTLITFETIVSGKSLLVVRMRLK